MNRIERTGAARHAMELHYMVMLNDINQHEAKQAIDMVLSEVLMMLDDLVDDNIKADKQEQYDGYANMMGYISELRNIIETL